jgi:hypothetical protein
MRTIERLWTGEIPPREAFWGWLVARGLVVNLGCTALALALVASAPEGSAWPLWLAVVAHIAAVPYNAVCVVGLWRGLDRRGGAEPAAWPLRAASVALFVAYLVL